MHSAEKYHAFNLSLERLLQVVDWLPDELRIKIFDTTWQEYVLDTKVSEAMSDLQEVLASSRSGRLTSLEYFIQDILLDKKGVFKDLPMIYQVALRLLQNDLSREDFAQITRNWNPREIAEIIAQSPGPTIAVPSLKEAVMSQVSEETLEQVELFGMAHNSEATFLHALIARNLSENVLDEWGALIHRTLPARVSRSLASHTSVTFKPTPKAEASVGVNPRLELDSLQTGVALLGIVLAQIAPLAKNSTRLEDLFMRLRRGSEMPESQHDAVHSLQYKFNALYTRMAEIDDTLFDKENRFLRSIEEIKEDPRTVHWKAARLPKISPNEVLASGLYWK